MKPSASRASFLLEASKVFSGQFEASPAAEYLEQHRGITAEIGKGMGLGFVGDSAPSGMEMYQGTMAVPYLRYGPLGELAVAGIRFRCVKPGCVKDENGNFLEDEVHVGHGKMVSMPGDTHRIYNTSDLAKYHDEIAICEGEFSTVGARQCGIPAVGIQGVNGWKDHFTELFEGYDVVWILADGDAPGLQFANSIAEKIPAARIVTFPDGHDVDSFLKEFGPDALLEKVGRVGH